MRLTSTVTLLAVWAVLAVVIQSPPAVRPRPAGDLLDSAAAEIELGRHWHAARILRPLRAAGELDSDGLLLLAEAEAGYRNWPAVRSVLEGADWMDRERGGEAWRLLGRALEEEGEFSGAAEAYAGYLASEAGAEAPDRDAISARYVAMRAEAGPIGPALASLDSLPDSVLRSWLALDLASDRAEEGDTGAVRTLGEAITVPAARRRGWELVPRARLVAGDSVGAEAGYRLMIDSLPDPSERARAWTAVGSLRLAHGDTAVARMAFVEALDATGGSRVSAPAADGLLELGIDEEGLARRAATALDRAGETGAAVEAYDLAASLSQTPLDVETRVARARVLSMTPDRHAEAISEFRELSELIDDRELGLRNLVLWEDLRRRQGRTGDVATIQGWILERYPESPQAVETVFLRGDASHDRGALREALGHYARLQEMNPTLDQSGLARMRMGQIHLRLGDPESALSVYREYLEEFPDGRRWDEATYWIGRILLESGDTAAAVPVLRGIGERDVLSYYAVRAAELLGEPYRLPPFAVVDPAPTPEWLRNGLRSLDLLDAADLGSGLSATLDELRMHGRSAPDEVLLELAGALLERGLTIEAINLGWELRGRDYPWTRELMELVYPFPYRKMVQLAAEEEALDPIVVAALMRQESAFDADIVSSAGAVGLMQVMPATGRQLARTYGPEDFSVASLEAPEVNLHLGTHFLREIWDRYGGDLSLVLSAYNAGPSRANVWRNFPEAVDPVLFTDRIPFRETRDYVKLVTRNVAIYRALYGGV